MRIARVAVWRGASRRHRRLTGWLLSIVLAGTACRSQDQILNQQRKTLVSLRQTVSTVADAWVSGSVSTAYARTALEETLRLLAATRADLVSSPELLADSNFADLSQAADQLSRIAAQIFKDIGDGNPAAVRQRLGQVARSGAAAP